MDRNSSKREMWNGITVSATVTIMIIFGVFVVKHYQDRKDARRKIAENEFKLRDNADARNTYIMTAPELKQSKRLHKIIDSLNTVNDRLVINSPQEYEKNKKLISHIDYTVRYNDSLIQKRLAQFDTVQNRLNREIRQARKKLK